MIQNDLTNIVRQMNEINRQMNEEERVYRAELADRRRLGLHGDAAIRHYNDWMLAHDMLHLMVREDET